MARTLPPHYVPLAYIPEKGKIPEPVKGSDSGSSIGPYLSSPEEPVVRDNETKADSSSSIGPYLSSPEEPAVRGNETNADPQNVATENTSSKEQSTISKPSLKTRSSLKEESSSTDENTSLPKSERLSLTRKRSSPQEFRPKPNLKSIKKFKIKQPVIRKKKLISLSSRNSKLQSRLSKRKISSSENEHSLKKQPKQLMGDSESISAFSERDKYKLENTAVDPAYDQPSTSNAISIKKDNDLPLNEQSAILIGDVSDNDSQNHSLKSSDIIQCDKLSLQKITTMPSDELSENVSNNLQSQSKTEKIERHSCLEVVSEDSSHMSADETEVKKNFCKDSFAVQNKECSSFDDEPGEKLDDSVGTGKASTSSKDISKSLSPWKSPNQQVHGKENPESTNPIKLLELKEMLKEVLSPQIKERQKKLRRSIPTKAVLEEKSPIQQSGGSCKDTKEETDEDTSEDCEEGNLNDTPLKNPPQAENPEILLKPKLIRKKHWYLTDDTKWTLGMKFRRGGMRYNLQKLFWRYSKMRNPWKMRVLRWINSVMPELKIESEFEKRQSGINLSTISANEYYIDDVDNIDVAAEISIVNSASEEVEDESSDLEEIDVETIDVAEKIDETSEELSDSHSPKSQSSSFHSPESGSQSPENKSSDIVLNSDGQPPEDRLMGSPSPVNESKDCQSPKK